MTTRAKRAAVWGLVLATLTVSSLAWAQPVMEMCAPYQPNTADKTCVVDGDTIWLAGENIRLEGFDTPEPQTDICGGEREKALAAQASARLIELLNTNVWTVRRSGTDRYGRTLATVAIGGRDIGEWLVSERLARWWPDGEEWWCD